MTVSGKFVILGVIALAVSAAGASWWFRYAATNDVAEFYGPDASRLIRDAPVVELYRFEPVSADGWRIEELERFLESPMNRRDISSSKGLTHLRNALLDDRSYIWPARPVESNDQWQWILVFRDEMSGYVLMFSPDWQLLTKSDIAYGISERVIKVSPLLTRYEVTGNTVVSCRPIAKGLASMLGELAAAPVAAR
jgi:hypothetical protein